MGLFDMFGAGGGTLTIQLQASQVAPGQMVGGVVTFTGGKRPQNITSIKVRLYVTQQQPSVPGKPPAGSTTHDVVPEQTLSGPFQVQPGQACPFQFAFQLPPQMMAEVRGQVDYKISAAADIPGEVDAGATADIQLIGGNGAFAGGAPAPGTYSLTGAEAQLATCGACVVIEAGMPREYYAAQRGTLVIDEVDTRFKASLAQVELAHVSVDPATSTSTVVDACRTSITAASWDVPIN